MKIVIILTLFYMIGSISFASVVTYLSTGSDIRKNGSGNAGASNVLRSVGLKAGLIVALGDFLKGFLPLFFSDNLLQLLNIVDIDSVNFRILLLSFITIGHIFPIWFKFRGGKGVSTLAGGVSVLFPPAVPFGLLTFILIVIITRYASVSSLVTVWLLPIYYIFTSYKIYGKFSSILLLFFLVAALFITIMHQNNIKRLITGEELKINPEKLKREGIKNET